MAKINKTQTIMISAVLMSLLASGCSGKIAGEAEQKEKEKEALAISNAPVTLRFAYPFNWVLESEFKQYIEEPVKKRYPNISFEVYNLAAKGQSLDELLAAGTVPDMVMTASPLMERYTGRGLDENIEPLIKKFRFDLTKLNKVAVDGVKIVSQTDYLIGLPWTMHFYANYYNKTIFDKFGVEYPRNGMTWEETYELGKKLTRNDGGIQYRGLEPDGPVRIGSIFSLPYVDPKTNKAVVNTDGWKKVFDLLKKIYDIPGNGEVKLNAAGQFANDGILAMYPSLNLLSNLKDAKQVNWDIVQYPQFKELPNTGMQVDEYVIHITKQSKYKDQAFQVLSTMLSEEVQKDLARIGRVPVMTGKDIEEEFGKNLDYAKGKNLKNAFLAQPAKPFVVTKHDAKAKTIMIEGMNATVKGQKDINTALREAEESINTYIATQ
ncbi:extracellular solute-binding protein [Paenibacillus hemerocallicola]|uniref:Extracellular solute-binding protein n=1 Tax=Paenibacillus hemerocallicola TaxID=1172614 RepID=A0A5C4TAG2_9BACL|nr:extracellular solute-binding protein [Paenibacillus hemerocallicola]TNJ65892.1 extracellular solute-binding protein [Paenibacillus hemerocallicola]